jgi:xeroderma pigmentosum group C-complementing protein
VLDEGIDKAAKLLGVDYANAVVSFLSSALASFVALKFLQNGIDPQTGFKFANRQASPVINGIVVACEYKEAVEAVMEGLLYKQEQATAFKNSILTLKRWRRFIIGLRIRQRVGIYDDDPEDRRHPMAEERQKGKEPEYSGGGFISAGGAAADNDSEAGGGGFLVGIDEKPEDGGGSGDDGGGGGFLKEESESGSEIERGSDMLSEDPEDWDNEDMDWM